MVYIGKETLDNSLIERKETTSRETMLRKYKVDLKQKEATGKQQHKFRVNQKHKIQATAESTDAKLSKMP